ncbi:substrate-binding periplasmic protein [Shewanella sp. YIC-542]|uniref:substrate-binding periplasmic protein n=1 Tax=Shewanella mytili TaxID=3377111 RepID=UPI00398F31B5
MKGRLSLIALLLLTTLNAPLPAVAKKPLPSVASVTNDAWPPFVSADGNSGLALEIIATALASQGVHLQVIIKPWARAIKDVADGKTDLLLAAWHSPDRQQQLLFSNPYLQNRLRFIKRSDDPFEYRDLASLKGKRIGVIRDYSYTGAFADSHDFIREPHQNLRGNLRMLAAKRLDLTLEDEIVASYHFYQLKLADHYQFTGPPLTVQNLYIAAGRNNPDGKVLIDAFNDGLKLMMEDGRYEQILAHYGAMLQSTQMPQIIRPTPAALMSPPRPWSPAYQYALIWRHPLYGLMPHIHQS